ncbi:hypothetical protein [Pseudomonas schmalbachii]|uniref:Uncharacterized protein n=1 Tax=Pseudomonas schmalbachii TaxID=2816993 RepID=A0ABS3TKI7_9PSED|nr:hypothetical protein [Pseudomonas schmalbachii]MBO3274172.1 hypothetical protein [Pseudomonas schmalbachii]
MPEQQLKPAAIVRSRYGDPEAFGERWLEVVADIQVMPYGTKLYAIPADQVLVPRDLVIRAIALAEDAMGLDFSEHDAIRDELRALLQQEPSGAAGETSEP